MNKKAQTEIISTVLIIGISVAAVSVAYLWGVPLIQKGQSSSQVQSAEATMLLVESTISDVVQNGGQKSADLNLEGPMEISAADNSVVYRLTTRKAGVATTEWTPINEDETFGISITPQNASMAVYGTDKSGVLIARARPFGGGDYSTEYRLAYRELEDTNTREGLLISLRPAGNSKVTAGKHTITVSRDIPMISATDTSKLGGALTITQVLVTLS